MGDFNDVLDANKTIAPMPSGTATSYIDFINDQTNYVPITLPLSLAGKRSTAGFPTVIDNVIISKTLNDNYLSNSADVLDYVSTLVISYSTTTTDHYPILSRYYFEPKPLPVTWSSFNANVKGNSVVLNWATKAEPNNQYFTIERSVNDKDFETVISVNSKGNQGANYNYVDQNPFAGLSYYRIKQVDINGKFSYSDVKSVRFLTNSVFVVYPNPVKNNINLNYTSTATNITLNINAVDGKSLFKQTGKINDLVSGVNQKLNTLPQGLYIIKLNDNGKTYQTKFVKE